MTKTKYPLMAWCLGVVLAGAGAQPAWADPARGKALFEAKKCGACHQTTGPVAALPTGKRASIKGPPLWFAGSKFQRSWLAGWLQSPTPIRRVEYGTLDKGSHEHSALSPADAGDAADYLMSLADPEMRSAEVEIKKLSRRRRFKAEKLFAKKQVCFGCHQYPARTGVIGGFTGPSLAEAGKRLRGAWIDAFMKDPVRYYPNGRMPVYGSEAFQAFTDADLKLLTQFIGNM